MRKRLIVLLWLGLYVLCLWLAVRAAAEAQQISPGLVYDMFRHYGAIR